MNMQQEQQLSYYEAVKPEFAQPKMVKTSTWRSNHNEIRIWCLNLIAGIMEHCCLWLKKTCIFVALPAGPMRFSLVSIKGAFIFATMDLIAFCALKWSVRGPRMRSNISSVVEFQRWWVLKSKIFAMWWPGFKDFI